MGLEDEISKNLWVHNLQIYHINQPQFTVGKHTINGSFFGGKKAYLQVRTVSFRECQFLEGLLLF